MIWKKITSIVLLLCMLMSMFAMPSFSAANKDTADVGASVDVAETAASSACVAGSFNSWSTTANTMSISGTTATATVTLSAGTYEFKIVCDGVWYGNYGTIEDTTATSSSVGWEMVDGANNCVLVAKGGTYLFKYNTSTHFLFVLPQYTVTFKNWDGTTLKTQTVSYGSAATAPSNPTRPATAQYTYTFSKWDKAYSNVTSNLTVTAVFTSSTNSYTVKVASNDTSWGTVSTGSSSVAYGGTTTLTASPKTGYHLSKWTLNNSACSLSSTTALKPTLTVKGAVTATATFAKNTGKVTFSAGTGGSVSSTGGNTTYSGSKSSTASASTGYYFTGWSITGGTLNTDYKITSGSTSSAAITIQPITNGVTITCKATFGTQYKITTQQNWGVLGSVTKSTQYVTPGNTVTLTASPDKDNGFNKWTFPSGSFSYTSGSATSTTITIKPTSDITAQANFYAGLTVSAGSGGSVSPSGKNLYDYNKSVTIVATPNTGYHFVEWTFGGTYAGSPSPSSASTTITVQDQTTATATFAINTYTVTFKNWDGTVLATRTVNHGSAATAPSNPTRPADAQYTYTFSKWDKAYSNVTSNLTVTAVYTTTTNKYTVTFKDHDGTTLSTQSIAYGSSATAPADPTRKGYQFTGWDKEFNNITGALTVTAQYKDVQYYLAGSFNSWTPALMTESNGVASLTLHLEPGTYTFKVTQDNKWYGNNGNIVDTTLNTSATGWDMYTDAGDCTLTVFGGYYTFNFNTSTKKLEVLYDPDRYTVTFFNWDGTLLQTGVVMEGKAATAPATPTKAGDAQYSYTFSGWDKSFSNVQSTLDIYAQFTQSVNKYTVTFKNWDGTVLDTQSVAYGSSATAPSNPTRPATAQYTYTFSGWDGTYTNITGNVTVTAKYTSTVNKYTVTFKNWDGTVLSTQSVEYGKSATAPSNPTRPATAQYTYTFKGWDKTFTNITGELTVTAQYNSTVNKYTVTFKNWDGTVLSTQSVAYGSAATAPSNPTRPATAQYTYTFKGWDKTFTNITGELTVTAQYNSTVNKYTVTFKNWDGTVLSTQSVAYGSAATAPQNPTRPATAQYTYTFKGWDKTFSNITGELTVTAQYNSTVNKYTVKFVDHDGTVLSTQSVAYGSAATAPKDPTRSGYEFTGWDADFSNITGALTVTAQYRDIQVYLLGDFNSWNTAGSAMSESSGEVVTTTLRLEPGTYKFKVLYLDTWYGNWGTIENTTTATSAVGWEMDAAADDCTLITTGGYYTFNYNKSTRMLEVLFEADRFTVTFVDYDDTTIATQVVMKGAAAVAPANPTREGDAQYSYTFAGWDTDFSNIQSAITVKATYTQSVNKYTVKFLNWDGTELSTQSVEYGKSATAPSNPTRPATAQYTFTFAGWDGTYTNITGNVTVTAQYTSTVNKYTVKFVNWDGTELKSQSVEYGKSATAPSNPTRPATAQYTYTFKGWDKSFTNITDALTVTAQYSSTVNKYTVKFVDHDGTELKSQSVEYGKGATAPADPFRDGYEFTGWDTDFSNITGALTVTAQYKDIRVFLLGDFNDWSTDSAQMSTNSDGTVSKIYQLEPGTYKFKILTNDVWYGNWGVIENTTTATSAVGWEMDAAADDCTLVTTGGYYTFTYNRDTRMLVVTYEADRFEVIFKDYDGTVLSTQIVMKGEAAVAPENPTRQGDAQYSYTFKGWDKTFANIQSATTVTATYTQTVNKYTVKFVNYDGTVLSTQSVEYGSAATAPKDPSRPVTGECTYTFIGWDTDFSNITGDLTVTAKYKASVNEYTITFTDYDGTVLKTETVAYGTAAIAPENPSRAADAQYTYTFNGWDKDFSNIKGDTTITATYTRTTNVYTVTFTDYDDSVIKTELVAYGSGATAPEVTAREGYEFTGWDKDFTNITGNTTVKAQYIDTRVYLLGSFNNWTTDGASMTETSDGIVSTTLQLQAGTYTFKLLYKDVWYGNNGTINDTTTATSAIGWEMVDGAGDCTLNASGGAYTFNYNTETRMLEVLYESGRYVVTFVDYDGTVLHSETVEKGASATAPKDPSREATAQYTYTFTGWDKDFSNIQAATTVTATYSQTVNKYTVTFVDWDGNELKTQSVEYGSAATAPADPTRESTGEMTYTFSGWDKSFSYITGDLIVTATYKAEGVYYKVTFTDYDGTVLSTQSVEYGSAATAPENPTRAADAQYTYVFTGWDTEFTNITAETTVKAVYTSIVNKYTVNFVNYNGAVLKTQSVPYGSAATAPTNPTRPSTAQYKFTFDGWDKDFSFITGDLTVKATYTATVNSGSGGSGIYDLSSEVQRGQILQCWNWSYNNIKYHMQDIASQGFSAIQTSPIQATKETTREYYNTVWNSSWIVYQPVAFNIETNSFNALGTKSEFEAMCAEAHKYGIKVIVDTIFNHTANDMQGNTIHPWVPAELRDNSDCWHDISMNIYNFDNRYDVTHYCLTGLPDLNTSNATVQKHAINFMKEAIAAGADGFRFDAAKHIETDWDADGVKSDFWYTVLGEATSYAQSTRGFTPYYYGEFIGGPGGGLGIDAYTRYMSVTDTGANDIRYAVANGNASAAANSGITYGESPNKAVLWTESHDNYKDDGTRFISDHNINKTWAVVGSRAEVCGLYLARPQNIETTLMGAADVTSWSYPEVKAINKFKNHFVGQGEYLSSYNNLVCVERGTTGIVIVNTGGTYYNGMSAPVHTMAAGLYTDAITGNTFTVSNGYISGDIGDTGIAVVYHVADNGPFDTGNPTSVSLVGSFNDWDAASHVMVADDKTTATTTVFLDKGTYTFKLTTSTGLWYGNSGTITDTTGNNPWSMYANVYDNCTLNASGGRYTFTFDSTTGKLSVIHESSYDYGSDVYLKGNFNNWGNANLMTYTSGNNIVSAKVTLEAGTYTFKLHNAGSGVWYGNSGTIIDSTANTAASGWEMSTSVSDNCTLSASGGTYTFNFNLSTNQLVVLHQLPTYSVKFVDHDGTLISEQIVERGDSAVAPAAPVREGDAQYTYTFVAWDKSYTNISADTVITATYTQTVNKYTVKFVDFDGTVISTQSVEYGSAAEAPADPVRDGHTFSYWDVDFSKITGDLTVTAVYDKEQYTVIFVNYDGTEISKQLVPFGGSAKAPENPTREADAQYTYTFREWDTDFSEITGPLTIKALYDATVNKYTVTFTDWNDTVLKTEEVEYGKAATAPEEPSREADVQYTYTFKEWSADFSEITGTLTVKAVYTETLNKYTVTFLNFDGTLLKTEDVEYGKAASAPEVPSRQGYAFTGWDADITNITGNLTVTAQYEEIVVTLLGSFNNWTNDTPMADAGSNIVTTTLVLNAGTYTFKLLQNDLWLGNNGVIEDTTTATSAVGWEMTADTADCTLNASGGTYTFNYNTSTRMLEILFTPPSYTVKFVDYDGTVLKEETVVRGEGATAPTAPTREDYDFDGWDKDFSNIQSDTTITATYREIEAEYTITFTDYDGTVLGTVVVPRGESATAPADPEREGDAQYSYIFTGWDRSFTNVKDSFTVTAQYERVVNKYTVEFVDFDGTTLDTQSVEYGSSAQAPENPTRDGYVFTGWDKDFSEITGELTVTAKYALDIAYLTGSFNDWATDEALTDTDTDGVVSITMELPEGDYFFKILYLDKWYGNTGIIDDTTKNTSDTGWEMTDGAGDCTLNASGGTYTFVYSKNTGVLEVLFTPPSYTVEFYDYEGTLLKTQSVVRGEGATAPEDPVREGYVFTGWDKDFSSIWADTTVYATYIKASITYTVTFLDWDGTVLSTQIVTTGTAAEAPEPPERENYEFVGWDKDFSNITYNLTVTAQYEDIRTYLVGSFNDWATDTVMTVTEGSDIVSTEVTLSEGEYFFKLLYKGVWYSNTGVIEDTTLATSAIGWEMSTDPSLGNCTLKASGGKYTFNFNTVTRMLEIVYAPVEYTVTFTDYDGTVLKTETVKLGADATAPESPEREGYFFSGWDNEFTDVTSDITVTAVYVQDDSKFTVTFVDHDGTVLSTQEVSFGESAKAPENPTRDGYVFTGWDKEFANITADTTVKAQYKENTVYLYGSFNDWAEGAVMSFGTSSDTVTYELTLEEGTYYFKLLHLDCWYGNTGNVEDTTTATSAVGWEMVADTDNLTLTASGGKYTFTYSINTKMLVIEYKPIEYTVVFTGFNGEVLSTQTVKLGADAKAPEAAEIEGYIFSGWDTDYTNIKADTTVKAVYLKDTVQFVVIFADYDGTVLSTQMIEYGKSATAPEDPIRAGYIFTGWDKDFSNITSSITVTAQYKDNQIYLVGSFNDWATELMMSRVGETDIFTTTVSLEEGYYYFKLLQNDVWYTNASTIIDTTKVTSETGIELVTDSSLGDTLLRTSGGTYTFNFNTLTNELEVLYVALDKYTVTFVDHDGTVLSTQEVIEGFAATAPAVPTREADAHYTYTFKGWDKSFTNITSDITITAQYTATPNKYTVTFLDTDGTVLSVQSVDYGSAAIAPDAPVKDGYVFDGWDADFSYVTGDITVKATYIAGRRSSVTLAGTFNGWNSAADYFLITTDADKVSLQMKLEEGEYKFKVVENGSNWFGNWGTIADTTITTSATGWVMDASAGDCTLIAGGGTYIFTYTISTHTLEVLYVGNEFKVTFVDWDGTVLKTEVVEYGGSATAPDVTLTRPEDDGYTYVFKGWDMDFTNVIAPLRVTAVYEGTAKMYTVTFVNYNGVVLKTQTVAYGTAATPPANPSRAGYIFTGWDGDVNYITGNTRFTAQYMDNGVYIMGDFNDWQGTKLTAISSTVYQGSIYLAAGQYKFKVKQGNDWFGNNGWIDDTTTYTSDVGWEMSWDAGDCTLNASGSTYTFRYNTSTRMLEILYVAPTYTVTFKDWNGATLKTQYVKRGNPAYAPANPSRAGYIFTGWDRDFSWIYENTVVTATYALNTVSVMGDFNNWEGTGMAPAGGNIYTATVELAAGTYKFKIKHADTWYGNGGTIENSTLATSDIGWEMTWDAGDCTLNAAGGTYTFRFNTSTRMLEIFFEGEVYTVTFLDWDGSIISTQQVEYGKSATAPASPVRDGYTFSGWSADFSFITGNTTIMAQYGDDAVYLRGTFNNWELSSPMRSEEANVYTYVMELVAGEYTFKVFTADLWYGNNGTIEDTTLTTAPLGWDMDTSAGDCKLVAKGGTYLFRFNTETKKLQILRVTESATVTFVDWDGTVIETQTVKYGGAAVAPTGLTRDGYTFVGWDKTFDYVTYAITVNALYAKSVTMSGFAELPVEMILTEGTKYEMSLELEAGEYSFDINYGGTVYSANNTFVGGVENYVLATDSGKASFVATSEGTYKFIFDTATNELTIVFVPVENPSTGDEIDPDNPSTGDEVDPEKPSTGDEITPDTPDEPNENKHLVIYVNGDGKYLGMEYVEHGKYAQNIPSASIPSDEMYIYSFMGWNTDLTNITGDTVATALFRKTLRKFTVTFTDRNGTVIDVQFVEYGAAAKDVKAPVIDGYTFTGWSKDVTNVTGDLTVKAEYTLTTEPVTTGKLKVEIIAGAGFTISLNGGSARPQGTSYNNSKAPIGAAVTVTAIATGNNEFLGWINTSDGKVLSTDLSYSFYTSGNDYIKAVFMSSIDGVQMVSFYDDKNNQYVDVQYYASTDSITFPEFTMAPGYDFIKWNMTEAEIKAEIAAGNDVVVKPVWERQLVYVTITVNGGTISGTEKDGKYLANSGTTVTANAAPAGQKFAYWADGDGNIKSYDTEYVFYPKTDMVLTAVFVGANENIDYEVLVSVNSFVVADPYGQVNISWYVPVEEMGVEYVAGGLIAVNANDYNEATFVHGTSDTKVFDKTGNSATKPVSSYTWTGPFTDGTIYYVKAWVQYKDATGTVQTAYSDMYTVDRVND